jgi:hypothetical protein
MSKNLLVVLAIVLTVSVVMTSSAMAQLKWEMGFKGGLNIADIYGDDSEELDTKLGFVGGVLASAVVNERFAVQIEVLYAMKGAKASVADSAFVPGFGTVAFDGDIKLKYDYIEIPVLAVFSHPVSDGATIRGMLGPVIAFSASSKIGFDGTLTVGGSPTSIDEDFDDDEVKAVDFGGAVGAGAAINVGSASVIIDARWTIGLMTTDDSPFELDLKNMAYTFTAGVVFPLGGGM